MGTNAPVELPVTRPNRRNGLAALTDNRSHRRKFQFSAGRMQASDRTRNQLLNAIHTLEDVNRDQAFST